MDEDVRRLVETLDHRTTEIAKALALTMKIVQHLARVVDGDHEVEFNELTDSLALLEHSVSQHELDIEELLSRAPLRVMTHAEFAAIDPADVPDKTVVVVVDGTSKLPVIQSGPPEPARWS